MNLQAYRYLLSQRGALNRLLAETGPDEVIVRKGLEHRLRQVETELKEYEGRSLEARDARLTFRGKPVSGVRGMSAQFFGDALNNFAKAVQYVGANQEIGRLPAKGPIPHKEDYEIAITGIARGSFGFQIEDAADGLPPEGQDTPVGGALNKIKAVLEASQDVEYAEYDGRLVEEIGNSDARALKAIEDFLRHIAKNEATFALEFRLDEVRFRDDAQVMRSADLLKLIRDKVKDEGADVFLAGHFHGYLPHNQRGEFYVSETYADFLSEIEGTVIAFGVDSALEDAEHINSNLYESVVVEAKVRPVGSGRPRFIIKNWGYVEE